MNNIDIKSSASTIKCSIWTLSLISKYLFAPAVIKQSNDYYFIASLIIQKFYEFLTFREYNESDSALLVCTLVGISYTLHAATANPASLPVIQWIYNILAGNGNSSLQLTALISMRRIIQSTRVYTQDIISMKMLPLLQQYADNNEENKLGLYALLIMRELAMQNNGILLQEMAILNCLNKYI